MLGDETNQLLDGLPVMPDPPMHAQEFTLAGYLVRGEPGTVRLIAGTLCLDFAVDKVVEVEEQELPEGVGAGFAIPVQVRLRTGVSLLNASPADIYEPLLFKVRRPFAISARPTPPVMAESPRYRELEIAFKQQHGLE